jgi:hypothetical protein
MLVPPNHKLKVNIADLLEGGERQTDKQRREKRERKIVPCQRRSKCVIRVSRKL